LKNKLPLSNIDIKYYGFSKYSTVIYKKAKYDLRKAIKPVKTDYKNKLESQYEGSDTRYMW